MADVAYKRVSSVDQNTDRQLEGLTFDKEFTDHVSGGTVNRPALKECLGFLRDGDVLHVHSIDRLARNLLDLQKLIGDLSSKGVSVHFHKENLLFNGGNDPMQKLLMQMLGAVAEFERSMIRDRQREGIAAAKAKGKHMGRASSISDNDVRDILRSIEARTSVIEIAGRYNVTRQTIYNLIKKDAEANPRREDKMVDVKYDHIGKVQHEAYEYDADGRLVMEEVPLFDINADGTKCYNLCCDAANSDPIRAARLLKSGTPEDLAELDRMNNTPMMRAKKKIR